MTSPDTMPVPQTAAESIAQCREQGLAEPEKVARESWPELFSEHRKPTAGPWLKDEDDGVYRLLDGDRDYIFSTAGQDEDRANALLAIEASNVHDETGLTPQQLRDALADVARTALDFIEPWMKDRKYPETPEEWCAQHNTDVPDAIYAARDRASAAIASVKGGVE